MKTLEYHWDDGTHTVFTGYTIDNDGVVRNVKTGKVMTQSKNANGYYKVTIRYEGKSHTIRVARAIASTFLGPPTTPHHTADHKDNNRGNDVLSNICWEDKSGQAKNRKVPSANKSAFIIEKDGIEHTANEWENVLENETTSSGGKYTACVILHYAQRQQYGFRYKTFTNLRGEVWKVVPYSKNKMGEWFISNKNRIKYKTIYAENVLAIEKLTRSVGYPVVYINGKTWFCHYLSMMTFRPKEYAAKLPGDIILHKNDNKLDFNPFRLRWGTPPENGKDAHKNGKYDGTKTAQKPVASYIDGVLEREHENLHDAARYLREKGYSDANHQGVNRASENNIACYDRTWNYL
ncbi:hypothetical protein ATCVNEJV2_164L [Acanthocystis turfacea Chlorella virus NE-JV-2]|nr:hypothetical protein ATCVNEJV2_164L [Acanthocystis turfacea Chlorella virus NE-JV-2]